MSFAEQLMKIKGFRKALADVVKSAGYWPTVGLNTGGAAVDDRGPSKDEIYAAWLRMLRDTPALRNAWIEQVARATGTTRDQIEAALANADGKFQTKRAGVPSIAQSMDELRAAKAAQVAKANEFTKQIDGGTGFTLQALVDQYMTINKCDEPTAWARVLETPEGRQCYAEMKAARVGLQFAGSIQKFNNEVAREVVKAGGCDWARAR
jgi:hypothetical protein